MVFCKKSSFIGDFLLVSLTSYNYACIISVRYLSKQDLEGYMSQQPESFLSVDEVAQILKMDIETVRKWIRQKKLKAYKFGRDYRIRRDDFDQFVKERATE